MKQNKHIIHLRLSMSTILLLLIEQLKEEYPIGAKIKAKIQSNRGADNCLVVCVIGERPGFLRVKYETTGYETTVHCKNVVG